MIILNSEEVFIRNEFVSFRMFTTKIFTLVALAMGVVSDIDGSKLFDSAQKKSSSVAVNKSDYQPYFASKAEIPDPKGKERLTDEANPKLQQHQQSIMISTFFEIPETEGMTLVIESLKVSRRDKPCYSCVGVGNENLSLEF